MAAGSSAETVLLLLPEADLDGVVAVFFNGLDLRDRARACFDDGNRDKTVFPVEYLSHSYLFSK